MEADVRQQQLVMIYANTIVDLLGFTGEDAARERFNLVEALNAEQPVDYDELERQSGKQLDEDELRSALLEPEGGDSDADARVGSVDRAEGEESPTLSTAKRLLRPGTPLSSCAPRSTKATLEPTTRSLTVVETSTPPGAVCPAMRAAMCTAMPPRRRAAA